MGPFTCQDGLGARRSYSLMLNGRPADGHYFTYFLPDKCKLYVDKKKNKLKDVSVC